MSRCIIVGSLPLLPRTARSSITKQIDDIIQHGLREIEMETGMRPSAPSTDTESKPFRIEVSINQHHRLVEIVKVFFSSQIQIEVISALCDVLQRSAAANPIRISQSRKNGHALNRNTSTFPTQRSAAANPIRISQGRENGHALNRSTSTFPTQSSSLSIQFVATYSLGAGSIRDHAFPSMPWVLRRQIQCDGVGAFSLTHERAANRTAKLLRCFVNPDNVSLVIDGMAGVGGNTLGFLKYWNVVTAVEVDSQRATMLEANIELWKTSQDETCSSQRSIDVKNMCLIDYIACHELPKSGTVLFLDPPWGGPQYQKIIEDQDHDIFLHPNGECHPAKHAQTPSHVVDCSVDWRFSSAVVKFMQRDLFHCVAMKLPNGFAESHIVDPIVHGQDMGIERTHPFRFHFGLSSKLVVLVRNKGDDPKFANGPAGLDRIIRRIMSWHNSSDLRCDNGCREHRPEFYDWEKRRWIMLKKWKGSKLTPR